MPCDSLGILRPEFRAQLRFLRHDHGWTLLVLLPAGKAKEGAAWVQAQTMAIVHIAPGLAPRTLRCELDEPPKSWLKWLDAAHIVQVDLSPGGEATMFVRGTSEQLAALSAAIEPKGMRRRPTGPAASAELILTPRQIEVLTNAVALGYYDIPHRVNLRALGAAMGLSVAAVSQLLRRAQAQIIRGFMDVQSMTSANQLEEDETKPALKP